MKKQHILPASLLALAMPASAPADAPPVLSSPGGVHTVELALVNGEVHARVKRGERVIVRDLAFGNRLADGSVLGRGLVMTGVREEEKDERYTVPAGKSRDVRDHYRGLLVGLAEEGGRERRFDLEFRAYDDGVAFRYVFPKQNAMDGLAIAEELTTLVFPDNHACWVSSWDRPHHPSEAQYEKKALNTLDPEAWLQRPVTIQRDDGVALCLYEAALTDYAGLFFRKVAGADHALRVRLATRPEGAGTAPVVVASLPHASPWRVIQIAADAVSLIPSDLVLNLNAPCRIPDPSWVAPGKVIFPWWPNFHTDRAGIPSRNTFENQQDYIDFAAANGIRYLELEPPWYVTRPGVGDGAHAPENSDPLKPVPDIRLPELMAYAREKGVGVFLWIHWSLLAPNMDEIMATYKRWGAVGMKVDFFDRNDQEIVRVYNEMAAKAADHGLMVFYHGADIPTGLRRTWPNLITREGVLGNEYNKWSNLVTLRHTVTIPFTRMIPGPMDFTPGGFRNVRPAEFRPDFNLPMVMGTRCRQLAMFVVYESPLQMVCDCPGAYRDQPGLDFLRQVPASWEETRGLAGAIGEYIVLARRQGDRWYLGAMTDEQARTVEVDLGFLEAGRPYAVQQWSDDSPDQPATALIRGEHRCVGGSGRKLTVSMAAGGGAVMVFTPRESGAAPDK